MVTAENDISALISAQIRILEDEWTDEVNKNTRENPNDYLRIGQIQGGINSLMNLLLLLDRAQKEE